MENLARSTAGERIGRVGNVRIDQRVAVRIAVRITGSVVLEQQMMALADTRTVAQLRLVATVLIRVIDRVEVVGRLHGVGVVAALVALAVRFEVVMLIAGA